MKFFAFSSSFSVETWQGKMVLAVNTNFYNKLQKINLPKKFRLLMYHSAVRSEIKG